MPLKIEVRKYRPEDAQALASIYYNTIHRINVRDYSKEQVDAWAPQTSLGAAGWAKKFEMTCPFVAINDGMAVGFAEFESDGHIDCFYCHHDWIGRGVGSCLMKAIHEEARLLGIKRLYAEVSITAKPFFERKGFTVVAKQSVQMRGVELTNYKMEKLLEF